MKMRVVDEQFWGSQTYSILTVPGGSSRPNKTSSVKKSKFSKLSLMPFCQITAELMYRIKEYSRAKIVKIRAVQKIPVKILPVN